MDREKKKYPYGWEEPLIITLLIVFLLQFLAGFSGFIVSQTGVNTDGFFSVFLGNPKLQADTPIGTKIINARDGLIYAGPGSDEVIGEAKRGDLGEVVGGPILIDGELWWEIEYEDGTRGWVRGSDIEIDLERDRKALKANTPIGTKVQATEETTVYSSPEGGIPVGTVSEGERGTIIGGPVEVDGERWWQVKYEDGTVGWVPESSLEVDVKRDILGLNDTTSLGTAIKSIENLDVFNFPRNGIVIGTQVRGALGTLVGGPVTVSTTRWWDVDFEEGVDGWVDEELLERQFPLQQAAESTGSFLRKVAFLVSAILGVGVIMLFFKLRDEIRREYHLFKPLSVLPDEHHAKHDKWSRVLEHVNSDNPNDWRLAILEADIMLEEMVDTMMLGGNTLGEKLKRVERADFKTIDKAWEAHKMRNATAHQGGDYILTQRETKRIIALYKDVFDEFHFV